MFSICKYFILIWKISSELPGNPGSANSFATQKVGSGDAPEGKKKKKKKVLLLSFDKYMELLKSK